MCSSCRTSGVRVARARRDGKERRRGNLKDDIDKSRVDNSSDPYAYGGPEATRVSRLHGPAKRHASRDANTPAQERLRAAVVCVQLEPCLGLRQGLQARPICEFMLVLVRQHLQYLVVQAATICNQRHQYLLHAYIWPLSCRSDADRRPSERHALNMTRLHETSKSGAARDVARLSTNRVGSSGWAGIEKCHR